MHRTARQKAILERLDSAGSASIAELMRTLGVSDETIRRDVKAMAAQGLVERVHGGVVLPDLRREPGFRKRMGQNTEAKRAIAERLAGLVGNGDSLILDSGSTTAYVARALAGHRDLLVVTNSVEIARTLADGKKGNRVCLAGGELRGDDGATFGPAALAFIAGFRLRYAVISVGALHLEDGVLDFHLEEAEFARAAIARAARAIAVADASKFRNQAPVSVCGLERLDTVITDRPPPPAFAERLREQQVELLLAR